MLNKKGFMWLISIFFIIVIIIFFTIFITNKRRVEVVEKEFEVEKIIPFGDSDRVIQIVRDNKNKTEYIVDGDNWVRRDK
ncbi:hypothetical protein [Floricoccus penangensis]|uniref:hypothetical protein n=1 Tax=Floricoccus penangensis TaxID=1859475 RepID=UPI00203E4A7E|nr:hypothetical protein [Floricoccus penangensis]URZ87059.1 hypothetical protein KIW23_08220 [Floricoccus penangensis]